MRVEAPRQFLPNVRSSGLAFRPPGPPRSCQALVLNRFSTEMKH